MAVKFPFGAASNQSNAGSGAVAISIDNTFTYLTIAPAGAITALNLTLDSELPVGSVLFIEVNQGGSGADVTPGTGFDASAPTLTGVANDTDVLELVFNGSAFVPKTAAWNKIVNAA